jgi:PDZ domain-containing protein
LKFRIVAVAASIVVSSTMGAVYAKDPALLSLSMEHFRDTATVKEDPLGGAATITTENGFAERTGPMRMVWNDEFLSGVIDKKTGQKSYQVYAWIIYSGRWRSYETATYQSASGPQSVPATKIGRSAANCAVGECTYTERIAFPVDEELLRRLAAGHAPGKAAVWAYRFIAKTGPDFAGGISSAEIAGLLAKVDEYTDTVPLVKANTVNAALKLDLGIAGMPVAATVDHPSRAGILIIGVDVGSVAQKSGLIVGDILYEFDGHPIRALAELYTAVAACAAHSAVAIKLYRGTDAMAVTAQF